MPADRLARSCARLLLDSLNQRYETSFALTDDAAHGETFVATNGAQRLGIYAAPLWEIEDAADWQQRLHAVEQRLDGELSGSYVLWLPPHADVPADEPAASTFVDRVLAAATGLEPAARTEVVFPARVKMAKTREEGGYASVIGGFSRWWTRITEKVQGTFTVDSSTVHRVTHDGDAREQLWDDIGRLSFSVEVGQAIEFDAEEAFTLQRLPDNGDSGIVIIGAPPAVEPTDGVLVRRTARRRLQAASEALADLDVELRAAALAGIYEYADVETAGATIKALAPSLYSSLQIVTVLADGEARPVFLPRALS